MNKKVILRVMAFALLIAFFVFRDERIEEEDSKVKLKEYDSNILCTLSSVDEETEDEFISNIYITYDEEEYVTKAIYQNVTITDYTDSYVELLKVAYELFDGIEGVETEIDVLKDHVVSTITYDYLKIDQKNLRKNYKDVLDTDSIIMKYDLPLTYSKYKDIELEGYDCKNIK